MSHFVGNTATEEAIKDLWQTPGDIFNALDREFLFTLDVCASKENALCKRYFTQEDSALDSSWLTLGSAFLNPPYSQTNEFLEYAAQQAKDNNVTIVALVNANTDTVWFHNAVDTANEVRLIKGRIGFVKADGNKANGNTKGQCLIIWRGRCSTPCQITTISRDDLA